MKSTCLVTEIPGSEQGSRMNKHFSIPFAFLGMAVACGDQGALDVGDESGKTGQALSDYAASWDGYAEAFTFAGDGEDRVRLTLDEQGAGVLRVGEEALFPPATDPEGLYPPTFGVAQSAATPLGGSVRGLRSGFGFSVNGAFVSGERLKFQVALGQLMDSWCALQAPEPVPGYTCGDGGYGYSAQLGCFGGDGVELDCNVAQQCEACECDAEACRAANLEWETLEVDAALTDAGDTLEGTLLTPNDERVTIRMTR
jgi:hypothetical protein